MSQLREAAQQALEAICGAKLCEINSMSSRHEMVRLMDKAITALRAALAEPAQEQAATLVAWRITDGEGDWEYRTDLPEDWSIQWSARYGRKYEPLYSAPIQRKPLTEEEIETLDCIPNVPGILFGDVVRFARAIERAHGIGGEE